MRIAFTPLTSDRHRLAVRRDDGTVDSVELETRSLLLHDLVHLAVESEAGLDAGFWGLVAAGAPLDGLRIESDAMNAADPPADRAQLVLAERLVGPMQAVWLGRLPDARYLELAAGATDRVDATFVSRVRARLRSLHGHWKATRHGTAMEITWPLSG